MNDMEWQSAVEKKMILAAELDRNNQFDQAIAEYETAYDLIPEPREDSVLTTILLCNLGELHLFNGNLDLALQEFSDAVKCKDGLGNPQIHLRLGQLRYLRGEMDRASDELMRAYMGAGPEIFSGEDDRYLDFIRPLIS